MRSAAQKLNTALKRLAVIHEDANDKELPLSTVSELCGLAAGQRLCVLAQPAVVPCADEARKRTQCRVGTANVMVHHQTNHRPVDKEGDCG